MPDPNDDTRESDLRNREFTDNSKPREATRLTGQKLCEEMSSRNAAAERGEVNTGAKPRQAFPGLQYGPMEFHPRYTMFLDTPEDRRVSIALHIVSLEGTSMELQDAAEKVLIEFLNSQ